jgi:Pyruvate/2-oxoacid:ferredoxin oxidoreductase delta subunit
MPDDIYRNLARRLDGIPNGFPATESGVELRLLAKIFTPEEAALASVMRLTHEPGTDIAARADAEPKAAYRTLKGMVRQGLIRVKKGEGQFNFGLMPFVVGIYEEQLPRMDEELAALFEEYYQETRAAITRDTPSLHRVIPVEKAIPFEVEIFPHEQAFELLDEAQAWGVRDCICRVQQRLIGEGCDRPVENCLVFAPMEGAFDHSQTTRATSKEDALRILGEAVDAGLVHSAANHRDRHYYICNCCTCCCSIMRGVAEFGIPTAVASSDFHAVVDEDGCSACGDCVESCQFGALSIPEYVSTVDYARCVGCGLCAVVCPTGSMQLERRPEGEVAPPPADIKAWMAQRAQERDISILDIL